MKRLSWILPLFLWSCTLDTQPLYSGVAIETGVAPFEEKGPLEMCVASHRILPPDGELGGFCQKRDSPDAANCFKHSDCAGARELCVCGKCTVKYCNRSDECPEHMTCDFQNHRCVLKCRTDCDCPGPNGRCDLGICQQMCIIDGECQSGELCSVNRARCITDPCAGDFDCFADERCRIQVEPRVLREPFPVRGEDGYVYMYLEMNQGAFERSVIFRASSSDGIHWSMSPPAPLMESGFDDDYHIGAPTLLRAGGNLIMFFEVGRGAYIGRAVSTNDGRHWTRDATPAILPAADETTIHAPSAIIDPATGRIRVYYEAGNGESIRTILSGDTMGTSFAMSDRQTVLLPQSLTDPILWRAVSRVHSPFVLAEPDGAGNMLVKLWVSAFGFESGIAESFGTIDQVRANLSIGYLVSTDGFSFVRYPFNPVFDRVAPNSFVNHESEATPAILRHRGKTFLYYGISDADVTVWRNLGWAVNPPRHDYPSHLP